MRQDDRRPASFVSEGDWHAGDIHTIQSFNLARMKQLPKN
jgi:hypothetical protein